MNDIAISVENLSKKYIIQHAKSRSGNGFRHALQDAVSAPFRAFRQKTPKLPATKDNGCASGPEEFWALKDISFEIKRGEVIGIIGRNGAGKSTLLKILSRITEPTTGRIRLHARVASLLEVGTGFHPELTGRENIFLNGAILGMARSDIRRRFDEIVDFAGVEKFLDTPVKRYSSGMYVRLAFAVAAHLEPEILIVDEVLAVGDAEFQRKCMGKMQDVARGHGRTVLFVSHNMGAIRSLCHRTIVLADGVSKFQGPTEAGLRFYADQTGARAAASFALNESKAAGVLALSLSGGALESGGTWDARRPGVFRVRYRINRELPRIELSLQLESSVAGKVGSIFAGRSGEGLLPTTVGEHEVELKMMCPWLVPGDYLVNVWLHDPMVELFDSRHHAMTIEVTNSGTDFSSLGGVEILGPMLLDPVSIQTVGEAQPSVPSFAQR